METHTDTTTPNTTGPTHYATLSNEEEINALVTHRSKLKSEGKWNEADHIQQLLRENGVIVLDYKDKTSEWKWLEQQGTKHKTEKERSITWSKLEGLANNSREQPPPTSVPFIICTVDTPHYRKRYEETVSCWNEWRQKCSCGSHSTSSNNGNDSCHAIQPPNPCWMLTLEEHPSIGVRKIVMEGWRRNLLPKLLKENYSYNISKTNNDTEDHHYFVFVAEDDVRCSEQITSCQLVNICSRVFSNHPHLDVLSLGHAWKELCNTKKSFSAEDKDLWNRIQRGKGAAGIHGATLFAIRYPRGVQFLQTVLETAATKKQTTHLDQFLFHSNCHDLSIALSDPPLVGWADVDVTLTKSPSGHRRLGGGRSQFLPTVAQARDQTMDLEAVQAGTNFFPVWVERKLT